MSSLKRKCTMSYAPLKIGTDPADQKLLLDEIESGAESLKAGRESTIQYLVLGIPLKVGQLWIDQKRQKRYIVNLGPKNVVYISGRYGYFQTYEGFDKDCGLTALAEQVWANNKHIIPIVETQMRVLQGICMGFYLPWAAAIAFDAGEIVVTKWTSIKILIDVLPSVYRNKSIIEKNAPTLFAVLFKAKGKDIFGNISGGMTSQNIGKAAGKLLGGLGQKTVKGKISMMGIIASALTSIVIVSGLSYAKGLPKSVVGAPDKLIAQLRKASFSISRTDAEKIIEEISRNRAVLSKALKELENASKKMGAAQF